MKNADEIMARLRTGEELLWRNPDRRPWAEAEPTLPLKRQNVHDAAARWERFAPLIAELFPAARASSGILESPLTPIPALREAAGGTGTWLLKRDDLLPVAGSIKARGGFYEVLKYAETIAYDQGDLVETDDYWIFSREGYRRLFAGHSVAVGSTGNLGLAVGIMGAALGFGVTVHMSAAARQWKKELLRARGVRVAEHPGDYSAAVAEGRRQAESDPNCHFVDDENSRDLFLGYSVAGLRLRRQLTERGIVVDGEHPLYVYLPCGVGGGPGGVTLGLKLAFGDLAHCWFAEPTHCPGMLLGMASGRQHDIAVGDIGLDGVTAADGLACPRPSAFVGELMAPLLDGIFTVDDARLFRDLARLADREGARLEPSALAGLSGPLRTEAPEGAVHVVWATGGGLVPPAEWESYYRRGKEISG